MMRELVRAARDYDVVRRRGCGAGGRDAAARDPEWVASTRRRLFMGLLVMGNYGRGDQRPQPAEAVPRRGARHRAAPVDDESGPADSSLSWSNMVS